MHCSLLRQLTLPAIMLALVAGCRTADVRSTAESPPKRVAAPVSQVAVLWSEAVLRQGNLPIAQGFSGKVYLFGADPSKTVTPPGKFIIYAYDETTRSKDGTEQENGKPSREWTLDESQLQHLLKKDAVGWSYSLWLPLGPPEPTPRNYTLLLTFVPENGHRVMSDSALVTLPAISGTPALAKLGK